MADPLLIELAALRGAITELRQELAALRQVLASEAVPPGSVISNAAADSVRSSPQATPASTLLARLKATRLNDEVLRRTSAGLDPEGDTEVDLLIDRLHDLVDPL